MKQIFNQFIKLNEKHVYVIGFLINNLFKIPIKITINNIDKLYLRNNIDFKSYIIISDCFYKTSNKSNIFLIIDNSKENSQYNFEIYFEIILLIYDYFKNKNKYNFDLNLNNIQNIIDFFNRKIFISKYEVCDFKNKIKFIENKVYFNFYLTYIYMYIFNIKLNYFSLNKNIKEDYYISLLNENKKNSSFYKLINYWCNSQNILEKNLKRFYILKESNSNLFLNFLLNKIKLDLIEKNIY